MVVKNMEPPKEENPLVGVKHAVRGTSSDTVGWSSSDNGE